MVYHVALRKSKLARRKLRVGRNIKGTSETPRLSVFRSLSYIYAQLIDDVAGKTLVDVSDQVKSLHEKGTKSEAAFQVGRLLSQRATEKKIKKVVFDRNGYRYHGRVKSLAEGAREGGLEF